MGISFVILTGNFFAGHSLAVLNFPQLYLLVHVLFMGDVHLFTAMTWPPPFEERIHKIPFSDMSQSDSCYELVTWTGSQISIFLLISVFPILLFYLSGTHSQDPLQ